MKLNTTIRTVYGDEDAKAEYRWGGYVLFMVTRLSELNFTDCDACRVVKVLSKLNTAIVRVILRDMSCTATTAEAEYHDGPGMVRAVWWRCGKGKDNTARRRCGTADQILAEGAR